VLSARIHLSNIFAVDENDRKAQKAGKGVEYKIERGRKGRNKEQEKEETVTSS
jgi:hypothetical protein